MPTKHISARRQKSLAQTAIPTGSLTAYLKDLPYNHPDRALYQKLTPPGSAAGSAPRTIKELFNAR